MNIKDFAHYYIGQRCLNTWFSEEHPNYNPGWVLTGFDRDAHRPFKLETEEDFTWTDSIKPVLRRLEDMTEDDMIGLLQSMVPADMEDKPTEDDYSLEMFYNDDGLMVDSDIIIGANYTCICFNGQIAIRECGSVIIFDEEEMQRPCNIPQAFHYLLKQGFDLFGLIAKGLAVDIKNIQPPQM
jgi:hypothetical protein